MSDVALTAAEHRAFCIAEGWTAVRHAPEHVTYELVLDDATTLRTRVAADVSRTYGPVLTSHVMSEQLAIGDDELRAFRRAGAVPARTTSPPPSGIPLAAVYRLIEAGLTERDVAGLTEQQAVAYLERYARSPAG